MKSGWAERPNVFEVTKLIEKETQFCEPFRLSYSDSDVRVNLRRKSRIWAAMDV